MNLDAFNNSRKIIIEDDNSLLMFENEQIIKISKYRSKIEAQFNRFVDDIISYGRMKERLESSIFGQINNLTWTHYPSDGRECQLLILGEKSWIKVKIKAYGEISFLPVLEKLSRYVDSRKQSLETRRFDEYSKLKEELKALGIDSFCEIYNIKITLEFIPEESTIEQEPESPLEEIRQMLRENPENSH